MSEVKVGQAVTYTEGDKSYSAIVIESRPLDDHMGADDEPLVHLGFFQQVYKIGPDGKQVVDSVVGTARKYELVQFRYDVAHESHEFEEQPDGTVPPPYPGGRYTELTPGAAKEAVNFPDDTEEEEVEAPKSRKSAPAPKPKPDHELPDEDEDEDEDDKPAKPARPSQGLPGLDKPSIPPTRPPAKPEPRK